MREDQAEERQIAKFPASRKAPSERGMTTVVVVVVVIVVDVVSRVVYNWVRQTHQRAGTHPRDANTSSPKSHSAWRPSPQYQVIIGSDHPVKFLEPMGLTM